LPERRFCKKKFQVREKIPLRRFFLVGISAKRSRQRLWLLDKDGR
jgi:hypothetical protein